MRQRSLTAERFLKPKINELLEMVRFAPSAINLQPWKIKIVTDQKVKEQLKPAAFNQEQITSCSHLLVFCADPDYDSLIRRLGTLLKKSGAPEEMQKMVVGMAVQFTETDVTGPETGMVAGPDLSCAGECPERCKVTGF